MLAQLPFPGARREAPTFRQSGMPSDGRPTRLACPRSGIGGAWQRRSEAPQQQHAHAVAGKAELRCGGQGNNSSRPARRARDAGSRSRERLSSAVLSKLAVAERCHPRSGSPNSRPPRYYDLVLSLFAVINLQKCSPGDHAVTAPGIGA